ncbi:hypothetical protein [Halosegnis marinus]|uniref:hypothetical protein n=1 Tax=Halosegnis marinus TaxID=3034023 RepID=UPI00361999F9
MVAAGVGGVLWGLHMLATPAVHSPVLSGSLPNASEGARERAPRWTRAKGVLALVFGLAMLGLAVAN